MYEDSLSCMLFIFVFHSNTVTLNTMPTLRAHQCDQFIDEMSQVDYLTLSGEDSCHSMFTRENLATIGHNMFSQEMTKMNNRHVCSREIYIEAGDALFPEINHTKEQCSGLNWYSPESHTKEQCSGLNWYSPESYRNSLLRELHETIIVPDKTTSTTNHLTSLTDFEMFPTLRGLTSSTSSGMGKCIEDIPLKEQSPRDSLKLARSKTFTVSQPEIKKKTHLNISPFKDGGEYAKWSSWSREKRTRVKLSPACGTELNKITSTSNQNLSKTSYSDGCGKNENTLNGKSFLLQRHQSEININNFNLAEWGAVKQTSVELKREKQTKLEFRTTKPQTSDCGLKKSQSYPLFRNVAARKTIAYQQSSLNSEDVIDRERNERINAWLEDVVDVAGTPPSPIVDEDDEPCQSDTAIHIVYEYD